MHIKTIKGKKYYYESKRIGKRVTSVYIGPVDKVTNEHAEQVTQPEETMGQADDSYIG
jgi:hypothetical protein